MNKPGAIVALMAVLSLGSCQSAPVPEENLIWVRTDGKRAIDDPALSTQFEVDRTVCFGEVQKSAVGMPLIYYQGLAGAISASAIQNQQQLALLDVMKGCMAGKGYVLVPVSQAEAVSASFRRT